MATEDLDLIGLLLARLEWPVFLVRERAATAIAELVRCDQTACARLRSWVANQKVESLAAIGILVLAKARGDVPLPLLEEVRRTMSAPSLLSDLLWEHAGLPSREALTDEYHSGTSSAGFAVPERFRETTRALLPPAYLSVAAQLDTQLFAFTRQWAFEAAIIEHRLDRSISLDGTNYMRIDLARHYLSFSTPSAEILRSAFLRALAWLSGTGKLEREEVQLLAADTSPVDLAIWDVGVGSRPVTWPMAAGTSATTGALDGTVTAIWRSVDELWHADSGSNSGRRVVRAAGPVGHMGTEHWDLSISGVLQRVVAGIAPSPDAVAAAFEDAPFTAISRRSPLRLEGEITRGPRALLVGGWALQPLYISVYPHGGHTWQAWRTNDRPLAFPHPLFGIDAAPSVVAVHDGFEVRYRDGAAFGRWSDWVESVDGSTTRGLPSRAGTMLSVDEQAIARVEAEFGASFMWICTLTHYEQRVHYEEYKARSFHRIFGGSRVARL